MWICYVSGSADPCQWLPAPDSDPALFVSGFQDVNNKVFFPNLVFLLLFEGTFTSAFKYKKSQKVIKLEKSRFFLFCLLDGRIRIHTNKYGSGRPKNGRFLRIRTHNAANNEKNVCSWPISKQQPLRAQILKHESKDFVVKMSTSN